MALENLKTAVVQMGPKSGNVRANLEHMLSEIAKAKADGVQLVIFPELSTSGYLLGDRWEYDAFIDEIEAANATIREASDGIAIIWGSVHSDIQKIGEDGRRRLYNAAMIAQNGEWVSNGVFEGFIPKTNLPKYRIFDDARHFFPADKLAQERGVSLDWILWPFKLSFDHQEFRVALAICEDLWEDEYNAKPSQIYAKHGADIMIDISCSPWTYEKWRARERILGNRVKDSGMPVLYVNTCGLQNNVKNYIWFDGDSSLIDTDGKFCWRAPQNEAGMFMLDLVHPGDPLPDRVSIGIKEIHDALIKSMQIAYANIPRAVIGLSGGLDSAVSDAAHTEALGSSKILTINMPTTFNSQTTRDLARHCAENLNSEYRVVPIQNLYHAHLQTLAMAGYPNPSSLVKENVQARIRGASVLAAVAAAEGGVFTNNGNKTEIALNYLTLYADGGGFIAWLGDLWKGQVYELADYINETAGYDLIPQGIIDIVPSAELSADQNVDEGKGDPIFYPYHDNLLRMFTEWRWSPSDVLKYYLDESLEDRLSMQPGILSQRFNTPEAFIKDLEWAWTGYNREFKRAQLPPVFLTSKRAFGFDRRDTIEDAYFTNEYYRLKELCLSPETV